LRRAHSLAFLLGILRYGRICRKACKIIGVFRILEIVQIIRLWNIPERTVAKNVAIRFRADFIIAVVGARKGDFIEKSIPRRGRAVYGVIDLENVVQIGLNGLKIDKSQIVRAGITRQFFRVFAIRGIFHLAKISFNGKNFYKVRLREQK